MRTRTILLASVFMLPVGQALAEPNPSPDGPDGNAGLSMKERATKLMLSDEKFVEKAAMGGQAEIELSKLAIDKSPTPQVRDFAKQMVKDHTAAETELEIIAQGKNIPVPKTLDREHQERLDDLKQLNGAQFDAKYIDVMEKDHDKTITLFTAAAADSKLDKQLQQFATKTLPVLQDHKSHVHALDEKNVGAR